MKTIFFSLFLIITLFFKVQAQIPGLPVTLSAIGYPWKNSELFEPDMLANMLKSESKKITVLNIGAVEDLPGSIHIGPASDQQNINKLKQTFITLPKNKPVVIYCGCCPFNKCPNIQPAYNELKSAGFTQIKVLNLPTNLKTDWIAKGYPVVK